MTLPAVDDKTIVVGLDGPDYKVGPRCSNPSCTSYVDYPTEIRLDRHHLIRRSALGKPFSWVAIDGYAVGNLTGLCAACHDDVTGGLGGHKAAIRWIDEQFVWCLLGPAVLDEPTYLPVAPLDPQPPTPDTLAQRASDNQTSGPETCPFCGQHKRRRPVGATVGRRRRKSWAILVPDDELEKGADVLDSLVLNLAPLIPNADASATGRYYVVVAALAHALIDSEDLVASIAGRSPS